FDNNFGLQITTDGTTWTNVGGWSVSPAYPYNVPAAAGVTYTFTGPVQSVLGFRVVGQIHSLSGNDSWFDDATEVQAFGVQLRTLDVIDVTGGAAVTLTQDTDHQHVDWTMGATTAQLLINDPNGLTINGDGGDDSLILDYSNGIPLANTLHLNGTFTIDGLQGADPLADTTVDIGRSTVFITYSGSDPLAAIQSYIKNGYNSGAWNGTPTASTGVVTSTAAQANLNHTTAIGYADSADGQGINTTPNTIELKYTLSGDSNLDGQVNSADLQRLLFALNTSGAWDEGDFNYDGIVNSADLQALLFTLNTSLGDQIQAATYAAAVPTSATNSDVQSKPVATRGAKSMPTLAPSVTSARRGAIGVRDRNTTGGVAGRSKRAEL
ncbi:MAG TPA: dockerin type I domain-containing protein, partial [Tepidisphaeraceae bacterium]|nr:dockerin type I domain-containing protein [Tepidisphaeraceae bacterium]